MLSMLGIETTGRKSHNQIIYDVLGVPDFELLLLDLVSMFLSQREASALKAEKFQPLDPCQERCRRSWHYVESIRGLPRSWVNRAGARTAG